MCFLWEISNINFYIYNYVCLYNFLFSSFLKSVLLIEYSKFLRSFTGFTSAICKSW